MPSSAFSIMVVDDEEEIAILFKRFLEKSGYNSVYFTDPILALDHFSKNNDKYHLIITDLKMPGLNGIQFANKIREYNKNVKILLITAYVVDEMLESRDFKEAKIWEMLEKPISFKELGPKIANLLST